MFVYAIYDKQAEMFNLPFFQQTAGLAKRAFFDLVNDSSSTLFKHPEDFELWCLGKFDDVKGEFSSSLLSPNGESYFIHQRIMTGLDVRRNGEKDANS